METVTLYFTPSQLAAVRGVSLSEIFKEIRQGSLMYQMTDEGMKIPVTYCISMD